METTRSDPQRGAQLARDFLKQYPDQKGAAGGVIAQAGMDHHDEDLLHEAVTLLREATTEHPEHNNGWYNLGNALQALSEVNGTKDPEKYLATIDQRRESRIAFITAGNISEPRTIATQALTNLANFLDHSGRWVEAITVYKQALSVERTNGAAAGNLAVLLVVRARFRPRQREQLVALASHYARIERDNRDKSIAYMGAQAAARFDRLPIDRPKSPVTEPSDSYSRWVADNDLALSLAAQGIPSGPRWDDLQIGSISEPVEAPHAVPALFAMANVLKQDFLFARRLAYDAIHTAHAADSAKYADTLDYALYGRLPAALTLAQRAALDLLDRIAVMCNDYLKTPLDPKKVGFRTYWTTGASGKRRWRSEVREELVAGNRNLMALVDLAADLENGGYLSSYPELRHTGTHRFMVLHDETIGTSASSKAVDHMQITDYQRELVTTLKISRAALLYAIELVNEREHRESHTDGYRVHLDVPDHHDIRGMP
jgi:tetratricopeptide (TPR) repeat protein